MYNYHGMFYGIAQGLYSLFAKFQTLTPVFLVYCLDSPADLRAV